MERAAHERDLRFVTTSRPGYGGSDRQPGRSVADVVADTAGVLASIGAERCLVAGWSGGGPHALACAARLGTAAAVLVIAGVAPYNTGDLEWMAGMGQENVVEFGAALEGEDKLRPLLVEWRDHLKDATVEVIVSSFQTLLPDVDRAALTDEFGQDMVANFHEALRTGVDGWVDDDLAFTQPWGFDLEENLGPYSHLARFGRPHGAICPRPVVLGTAPGRNGPPRTGRGPSVGRDRGTRTDAGRARPRRQAVTGSWWHHVWPRARPGPAQARVNVAISSRPSR